MKRIKTACPSALKKVGQGDFGELNAYLNSNFREYGKLYDGSTLLEKATGVDKLSVDIFFEYLQEKYL